MPAPQHPPPGPPQATTAPRLRRRLVVALVALVALGLLLAVGWLWRRTGPAVPGPAPAVPGTDAGCAASITPLAKLRAAVVATLPNDSMLARLLARIEKEEDTAQRADAAVHQPPGLLG